MTYAPATDQEVGEDITVDGISQDVYETAEVAVVALTASADEAERDALLEAGAVACLMKDQELDVIVSAILQAASPAG